MRRLVRTDVCVGRPMARSPDGRSPTPRTNDDDGGGVIYACRCFDPPPMAAAASDSTTITSVPHHCSRSSIGFTSSPTTARPSNQRSRGFAFITRANDDPRADAVYVVPSYRQLDPYRAG